MRLISDEYSLEFEIIEEKVNVIYIENRSAFTNMVRDIWNQSNGGDGMWIISEKDRSLNILKSTLCNINPMTLDYNDKKLLKVLYQDMEQDISISLIDKFAKINYEIIELLENVIEKQPYNLDYLLEVSVQDLLKLYNVHFSTECCDLAEQISTYIKLWHRVAHIELFVFVNLKMFLTDEEIKNIYEMILYEKIKVILFESNYIETNEREKAIIIDKDLCIINC